MGTHSLLTSDRRTRVLTVALAAAVSLYALLAFVAEPLRTMGATTADTVVQFTVNSNLSITCSSTSTLGSASVPSAGTGALATATCTPITNNSLGYTLSWIIQSSTGSVTPPCTGNCWGTGHLLSNNVTSGKADTILAFDRKGAHVNVAGLMNSTTIGSGSGSRWGARLMASSTTNGGGSVTWGSEADNDNLNMLNVATGSAVNIAKRTTETSSTGDIENFLFKVFIPSGVFQPTGTYKATIRFTVTDNS